ncbi:MAG: PEP/pyruvate-binding domain-containing protein [Candidatus Binatia bacterium]|nr:PEP/pyruvate-binding domain-containing protein [Candidatus Binatia bacterium]
MAIKRNRFVVALWAGVLSILVLFAQPHAVGAAVGHGAQLDTATQKELKRSFALCLSKKKGPYSPNFCVCQDGAKKPVQLPGGRIVSPCGTTAKFCAAYRTDWAQALAKHRMYIANIFSRDLEEWDKFPDHHDLVRGYILEKFFIDTHPEHKLAEMRAYGGLSGAEYEARDAPLFAERYLSAPSFDDDRHHLLAYELQRRFFVRDDQGQIQTIRNLASRTYAADRKFKPLRDATHNQVSAALLPRLEAYRKKMPAGAARNDVDTLIKEIRKLTSLDESVLIPQIKGIQDGSVRETLQETLPGKDSGPVAQISGLAKIMVEAREAVRAAEVTPADRRRLLDISVTASAVIQRRGSDLLGANVPLTVRQDLELLAALTDAAYGAGLLTGREWKAAIENLRGAADESSLSREELQQVVRRAKRVVEWAQTGVMLAFEEVLGPWTFLLPSTAFIADDVLRGSPLLLYAGFLDRLETHASGTEPIRHRVFGENVSSDIRALNPGLAVGTLRINPKAGTYSREEIVALPETPPDLQPAAGILTQGEGNVVSHVQLLARALGIPNVVLGAGQFKQLAQYEGEEIVLIATPGGRVHIEKLAEIDSAEQAVVAEFGKSAERSSDGSLGAESKKLHIDRERLDISSAAPLPLSDMRRKDSGVRAGPKASFLGELRYLFPDNVARGVVVPFGAYYAHFQAAQVSVPKSLAGKGIAQAGEPLPTFVEATYAKFFGEMIPAGASEKDLSAWIRPRLEVMQYSLQESPLAPDLKTAIRDRLKEQGLLDPADPSQTVGCFVRSDTNVEDLDDFNGAGLNLTLFNLHSLDAVYAGIKEVWASPFSYRSFSWRQTLIDEPMWVLPSIVILESIPSEKSGVLVTADIETGDQTKMLVATSEGVGGAVDGTPAETLLWSDDGIELITMFKSPWRRLLQPGGGSKVVPATGSSYVLSEDELEDLIDAAQKITEELEPALDSGGKPMPWDVEFGFADGHLWLFQTRPFVGNEELKNMPALAALDGEKPGGSDTISLEETLR